jgi:hypothetical protein
MKLKKLPGIGDKTADYLKILTGHKTNATEQIRISELDCSLNVKWSWFVENYQDLSMADIPK